MEIRNQYYRPLSMLMLLGSSLGLGAAERPNILVIIADDISRNDFGCYGHPTVKTPHIDALAAEGIRFDNVFLTTSSSSPSRASIMTGRYPHNTGAAELHAPLGEEQVSIARTLKEAGYYTAQAGKWHFGSSSSKPEGAFLPDFDRTGASRIDGGGTSGAEMWVNYLSERPKDKPFFMWFAAHDAHRVWDDDKTFERYDLNDVIVPSYYVDDEQTRRDFANYYYEVSRFDYHVGQVVKELKREGIFDNTVIIVMADNGRAFVQAKTRMITDGIQTPFIVSYPKGMKDKGAVCESLVSTIDIAPTIIELAACEQSKRFQGRSFKKLLNKPSSHFRNYAFAEHNWHDYEAYERMVTDGEHLLIVNERTDLSAIGAIGILKGESGQSLLEAYEQGTLNTTQERIFCTPRERIELYNYLSDPLQEYNIAQEHPAIVKKLISTLEKWQEQTDDTLPKELTPDWYSRTTMKRSEHFQDRGTMPGSEKDAKNNTNKSIF